MDSEMNWQPIRLTHDCISVTCAGAFCVTAVIFQRVLHIDHVNLKVINALMTTARSNWPRKRHRWCASLIWAKAALVTAKTHSLLPACALFSVSSRAPGVQVPPSWYTTFSISFSYAADKLITAALNRMRTTASAQDQMPPLPIPHQRHLTAPVAPCRSNGFVVVH